MYCFTNKPKRCPQLTSQKHLCLFLSALDRQARVFEIVHQALSDFSSPLFAEAFCDALCSYVIVLTYLIGDLLQRI